MNKNACVIFYHHVINFSVIQYGVFIYADFNPLCAWKYRTPKPTSHCQRHTSNYSQPPITTCAYRNT